ncbi:MAG: 5' nucleotidase, NT5C type [Syntrophomonadaceae bacterium]|mgnify:CR=1 FL=1
MKIGVDIDNTITYTTEMIMQYATLYGQENQLNIIPDLNHYYIEDALGWDKEHANKFLLAYLGDIYRNIKPKEQAVEVLQELKKDHELVLITSRNLMFPQVQEATSGWLTSYGIEYDHLVLNTTDNMHFFSKLDVCLKYGVDVMIEDHHELAAEISEVLPVILFDYPYNRHLVSDNIVRVNNWNEIKIWISNFPGKK